MFSPFTFSLTFYCRKQTGPLTSTGVPSPPLSHGVSSPGCGGIPTGGDPRSDTGATRSAPLSICARTAAPPAPPPPPPAIGPCYDSLSVELHVLSYVARPPGGPPPALSPAHSLGLTVFPEVPCCQVTLCPSATTDRAFPYTDPQQGRSSGSVCTAVVNKRTWMNCGLHWCQTAAQITSNEGSRPLLLH